MGSLPSRSGNKSRARKTKTALTGRGIETKAQRVIALARAAQWLRRRMLIWLIMDVLISPAQKVK